MDDATQDGGVAARRRSALDQYGILDTPAEADFDDIVKMASDICGTPVSLISLLDTHRQWFKARVGFEPAETPISSAICAHAIQQDDLFIIPDTTRDARTDSNPLVTGEPHVRFYAGMPLRSGDGVILGTLCVLDTKPRQLNPSQQSMLRTLARQVTIQLELRRALREQQRDADIRAESESRLQMALKAGRLGLWEFDLKTRRLTTSAAFKTNFGFDADSTLSNPLIQDAIHPDDRAQVEFQFKESIRAAGEFDIEHRIIRPDGSAGWILARGHTVLRADGTPDRVMGVTLDITGRKLIEQRFALSEERLNLALNASGVVGIWDWDIKNDLVYADANFARIYDVDPKLAAEGAALAAYTRAIHPADQALFRAELDRTFAGRDDFSCEYRLVRPDGSTCWVLARGSLKRDDHGNPVRFPGAAVEINDRKRAETRQAALVELGDRLRDLSGRVPIVAAATEILGRVFGVASAGFAATDAVRETIFIEHDWCAPGFVSLAGLHQFRSYGSYIEALRRGEVVVVDDVATDSRMAPGANEAVQRGIKAFVNLPVMEHGRFIALVYLLSAHPRHWAEDEIVLLRNAADRIQAAIARVEAEEQQRMLNLELSHRMKNMLSMVQAIASQTLRGAPDMPTAKAVLSSRLVALGQAHDILLGHGGSGLGTTPLRGLIEGALRLHQDGSARIAIDGPDVAVAAKAGLSISLILHELATNAIKYGSLSTEAGGVTIEWHVRTDGPEPVMELRWTESGGPAVAEPARKGFGSRLIERGLASSARGKVNLVYGSAGVTCLITSTLADLQAEHGPLESS